MAVSAASRIDTSATLDANNFFDMVSYSIGTIVIEYPVMLAVFYGALFIGGLLLAVRCFSKHQVV